MKVSLLNYQNPTASKEILKHKKTKKKKWRYRDLEMTSKKKSVGLHHRHVVPTSHNNGHGNSNVADSSDDDDDGQVRLTVVDHQSRGSSSISGEDGEATNIENNNEEREFECIDCATNKGAQKWHDIYIVFSDLSGIFSTVSSMLLLWISG